MADEITHRFSSSQSDVGAVKAVPEALQERSIQQPQEESLTFACKRGLSSTDNDSSNISITKKRKLEYEEQRVLEESERNIAKENHAAIKGLIERNRKEIEDATANLKKRYQKEKTYYKNFGKPVSATEAVKAEVQRVKRSLIRFVDTKIAELFKNSADQEDETAAKVVAITEDKATQTDFEVPDVTTMLFGNSAEKNMPSSLARANTALAEESNPFLNAKVLPPLKPLFGFSNNAATQEKEEDKKVSSEKLQ